MTPEVAFQGGCLCGRIRYTAADPIDAGYCHCRLCQRSSGAPVLAWITFPAASFAYVAGAPARYRSSDHGEREFCPACGTQLVFRDTKTADTVDVNHGSLDDPEAIAPEYHIFTASRIGWFETADDLPRYEGDGPRPTPA